MRVSGQVSNVVRMTQLTVAGVVPAWTLADRLRKARETSGMNQSTLGEVTGISRRSISSYESGEAQPKRPQLIAWAMATGVPLRWLENGESPRQDGPDGGSSVSVLPRLDSNQQPSGYTEAQVISLPERTRRAA